MLVASQYPEQRDRDVSFLLFSFLHVSTGFFSEFLYFSPPYAVSDIVLDDVGFPLAVSPATVIPPLADAEDEPQHRVEMFRGALDEMPPSLVIVAAVNPLLPE